MCEQTGRLYQSKIRFTDAMYELVLCAAHQNVSGAARAGRGEGGEGQAVIAECNRNQLLAIGFTGAAIDCAARGARGEGAVLSD